MSNAMHYVYGLSRFFRGRPESAVAARTDTCCVGQEKGRRPGENVHKLEWEAIEAIVEKHGGLFGLSRFFRGLESAAGTTGTDTCCVDQEKGLTVNGLGKTYTN
jgi:hypothetical protein